MTRPVLLICGCQQYKAHLQAAIRRFTHHTWRVIGVIGGGSNETAYDPVTGILVVAAPDEYEALPRKIHAALTWIVAEWPDVPGVFKTDDDILVQRLDELAAAVRTNIATPYWGLVTHRCYASYVPLARIQGRFNEKSFRPKHQTAHYCFGHGYWLSATALATIVGAGADYASSYLEDVCTGFVMNRAGVDPVRIPIPYKEMPRTPELLLYNYTSTNA